MIGLVLTAGGARGAYQAGVLKRLGEARVFRGRPSPFQIVAGASAGAINGSMIAATSSDFADGTKRLGQLWSDLRVQDVFRSDAVSLGLNGLRFLQDLTLGSVIGGAGLQSLLDASPLRGFLQGHLSLDGVARAISEGHLYALAVTATSYHSGKSYTFVQGKAGHPLWVKSRRVTLAVDITLDHVLASAAIPIVFQPVRVATDAGEFFFGDGGLRLVTPLSPAIRLGASRVLAIGVRCQQSADDLTQTETAGRRGERPVMPQPPISQICGVFMNAIFLDHLDADLDHLKRMNQLIEAYGASGAAAPEVNVDGKIKEPMRIVEPLSINPSEDLAMVAKRSAHRMPRMVRFLLDGLGSPDAQSADLMSYLLFDANYTRELVDIGYNDADKRIDEIESFIAGSLPVRSVRARGRPALSRLPSAGPVDG